MKITKRQLKRIIKEEKSKLLNEQWGQSIETGSDLIEFAKAYSGLGSAVQEQFDALASGWIQDGAHEPEWSELVYEQNPNAIGIADQRLRGPLTRIATDGDLPDAEQLLDMLEDAMQIYAKGDAEMEADRMAAEGMDEGEY